MKSLTLTTLLSLIILIAKTYGQHPLGPNHPANVPDDYLITPNGYFPLSCVHGLKTGDSINDHGTTIAHRDGSKSQINPCGLPHYDLHGQVVTAGAHSVPDPEISHSYIEYASTTTSGSYNYLSATWTVPSNPTTNDGQTIYLFPGLEDIKDQVSIVQPVLGWYNGSWTIASWNCCISGNTFHSAPIPVNVGDMLSGSVASEATDGTVCLGTCPDEVITTTDETTHQTTTLPESPVDGQTFNWAFAAALEVYDVSQCSDYPPPNQYPFSVALYSLTQVQLPAWSLTYYSGLSPQCYQSGQVSSTGATLDITPLPLLNVSTVGLGSVASSPAGLSCTNTCSAQFQPGTAVTLTATPAANFTFEGWSGACSGTSTCKLTLSQSENVTANFEPGPGVIETVAGNGGNGDTGDGGYATNAELSNPGAEAVDANGNIYIADSGNFEIRKVAHSTGIITTIAGSSGTGSDYTGDGGPAVDATLIGPQGITVDTMGNIYIAEYNRPSRSNPDAWNGSAVRMISASTGIITTVAGNGSSGYSGDGGVATSAALNDPTDVAVDRAGNIYIADRGNSVVRKVNASTGIITTIAGTGTAGYSGDGGAATSAELYGPSGIAVDSAGDVYIADSYNARIRKVTAATGIISTVVGNGTAGFRGDGTAATSAELSGPTSVRLDSSGNLYIADAGNYRVRLVTLSTGIITTFAGNGTPGYTGNGGLAINADIYTGNLAIDAVGTVYLADYIDSVIRVVGK